MSGERPLFFYDLGSPYAYLAAERVNAALPVVPEWRPIQAPPAAVDREEVERLAAEQGLMPLRWPSVWPPDTRVAMLAATFAKESGRAVAFSLAAFRQAFAAGRDLGDTDTVLLAAAACELHPRAVLKGIETASIARRLEEATAEAAHLGVAQVPALAVGGRVLEGAALHVELRSGDMPQDAHTARQGPSGAVLRAAYDALNRGDLEGALAPLAADAEWHEAPELPGGGVFRGRDAIAAFLREFLTHWDEFRQEVERVVERGDRVAILLHSTTRVRDSSARVEARYAHVWTMREGRGVRVQAYYDTDDALRALDA